MFYIVIYFGSPRPKAAILEQSMNYGESYVPLQYYADDCMEYFGVANDQNLNGVACTTMTSM